MNEIQALSQENCVGVFDDILVYSKSVGKHVVQLKAVLEVLKHY